jgi:hypothetical protein
MLRTTKEKTDWPAKLGDPDGLKKLEGKEDKVIDKVTRGQWLSRGQECLKTDWYDLSVISHRPQEILSL